MNLKYNQSKKSPFKFFLVIIIIIMLITVLVDISSNEQQLNIPGNAGILHLSTCQNYLVAFTKDNHVHLWDWNDLPGDPLQSSVSAYPAVVLDSDKILIYEPKDHNSLVIRKNATHDTVTEFPLSSSYHLTHIAATRNRSMLAVLLENTSNKGDNASNVYQLVTIHPVTEQYQPIINIGGETAGYQLNQCAVSDDRKWVIILGARQDEGVIIVIDISQKKIVREIDIPGVKIFDHAAFEPEGAWFFAGGDDLVLYQIQTDSGQILSRIPTDEEKETIVSTIAFFDIDVSPDGKAVAAITTTRKGGVWDCASGKKFIKSIAGSKISSTVAFSPDSRLLAVGPLQAGGQISIFRLPE